MASLQNGTVVVTNGSSIVRHVWTLVVQSYITLTPGEAVTWGIDGQGVFLSYDPVLNHLRLYRTLGAIPAIGNTIDGLTGSAVITQMGPGSPGNWTSGIIGSDVTYFHVEGLGVPYIVQTFNTTDSLTLTAPWASATFEDVPYSISQDYTAVFRIPLIALGDIDPATRMSLALQKIDTILDEVTSGQHFTLPTSDPAISGRLWNDGGTIKVSS